MKLGDKLLSHLLQFPSPPYLFVGSGMSRRYLGLADWAGLLKELCEEHDLNHGFLSTEAGGNLPHMATLMAKEIQKKWWKEDKYKKNRQEYKKFTVDGESALKIETVAYIKKKAKLTKSAELLEELELFKKVVADGAVTTNWDNLLELIFPDHTVYVGQEGLIFSQIQGISEIYKIHGTQDDPLSLVFTESDYEKYKRRNPYLASKLLTLFVENPVVFLGYSLTDKNILEIIHSILDCLSNENVEKLADRLVFIQWDAACTEPALERTILSYEGRALPVMQGRTSSMSDVLEALGKISRKIPAKMLRILKQQVYQLVHTTNPTDRVYVQDIDSNTPDEKIEFAIGVGLLEKLRDVGYVAISRENIARDLIFKDQGLNAQTVVEKTLPELLKRSQFLPVLYYLDAAKKMPTFKIEDIDDRVRQAASHKLKDFATAALGAHLVKEVKKFKGDFKQFAAAHPVERTIAYWSSLPNAALKPDQIEEFLRVNFDFLVHHPKGHVKTHFFKLLCAYDFLRSNEI